MASCLLKAVINLRLAASISLIRSKREWAWQCVCVCVCVCVIIINYGAMAISNDVIGLA